MHKKQLNQLQSTNTIFISIYILILIFILTPQSFARNAESNPTQIKGKTFTVIGQNEQVIISNPKNDRRIQALAKIDTGADRTSIGTEFAKTLGLELENTKTVRVISGTGEEKRPVVDIAMQIAGRTLNLEVSVTDRATLSTQMIIGKDALAGFIVNTSQDQITQPEREVKNTTFLQKLRSALQTDVFSLSPEALLALIPLAAVLVVAFRSLIGLGTFGIFAPILIAISFTETGVVLGSFMFITVVLIGIAVEPPLRTLRISRTSRLAVLLTVIVLTLLAIKAFLNFAALGAVLAAAFPAVITVAIIEQLWERWEQESFRHAITIALWTALIIILTGFILSIEFVQILATRNPLLIAGTSVVLCLLLGRYRGLRVTELSRFETELLKKNPGIENKRNSDFESPVKMNGPKENPLGMNARNDIIYMQNPAKAIFQVNNKYQAKEALEKEGIPVTPTLKLIRNRVELRDFNWSSLPDTWALKPNCGKGGSGIMLASERDKEEKGWRTGSGRLLTQSDIEEHINLILEGEYSMNGQEMDWALFEPLIEAEEMLGKLVPYGLPDIRVICDGDKPILAMTRLPTEKSEGRANLHQSAIGAGIDLKTGKLTQAYFLDKYIEKHPDTDQVFEGVTIPEWGKILDASAACSKATGLGYLGVDIVIDKERGPLIIEVNAHPGLEIQNVAKQGLKELISKVG